MRKLVMLCLALALATVGVYWQVHNFDFVNYDDPDYVTRNAVVKGGLSFNGIAPPTDGHIHQGGAAALRARPLDGCLISRFASTWRHRT